MGKSQIHDNDLEAELEAVRQLMVGVADPLDEPLRHLVQARISQATPMLRAGVVLAAAINNHDDEMLRRRRIHLAAALEMLHVAHNIHKLLLASESAEMDTSVMGSTILAGDYCFSHAALLAASTDSPDVVAIFAQALKTVSENNLKYLFDDSAIDDEDRILFEAGVHAAVVLACLSSMQEERLMQTVDALSQLLLKTSEHQSVFTMPDDNEYLLEAQERRWRQLFDLVA